MADRGRGNVRQASAVQIASYYNVRNRLTLTSAVHVARLLHPDTDAIEIHPGSDVYLNFQRVAATDIKDIASIANSGGDVQFTSTAHGYANGRFVALRGFDDPAYNVMATVANTAANTFTGGITWSELMPNQVDRDFSGASAWTNVDINAYDETTDLTLTANAADQYCTLAIASFPTVIGKRYTMYYDLANIAATWTVQDFTGTQTIGTISANATQGSITWTATTYGGLRLVAVAATSSGDFDNFKLQYANETGQCVLVQDEISTNNTVFPASVPVIRAVPKGDKQAADDGIVLHIKQVTSVASPAKYCTLIEL